MLKRTALYSEHVKLGGRLIDFGGWELPVQYVGIAEEHRACRSAVGLFDVSHMGEIEIRGDSAEAFLDFLVAQDISQLALNQAVYTVMCHESGGVVDDLVIYRRAPKRFLVVVNASNTEKDFQHILATAQRTHSRWKDLKITNDSADYTQIAIQGRHAEAILAKLTDVSLDSIKTYWSEPGTLLQSIPSLISRTGYTGEDGFEIYVPWDQGPKVWQALLEEGTPLGLQACGLGARDTLRLEMKYALYGNELTDETLPLEAGLAWVVKLGKASDFQGKAALLKAKERGLKKQVVGIKMKGKGIPRHGYTVYSQTSDSPIGVITSGTQSPSLNEPIGIASVDLAESKVGTPLAIDIRGNRILAEIVPTPFYKRPY